MLTPEQQAAIQSVFGQFVLPMPDTIPANNKVVCDGLAAENFDPSTLGPLGLHFEIIGLWEFDGENSIEVVPLNETAFMAHLPLGENGDPPAPTRASSLVGLACTVWGVVIKSHKHGSSG